MTTPDCFLVTLRKARKEHHCCECPAPIIEGEIYEYSSGVWEGNPASFKTCLPCAEFREEVISIIQDVYGYYDALIFGQLQDEAHQL